MVWIQIKKYRYLMMMGLLLIVVGGLWSWLTHSHHFPIRHIKVEATYQKVTQQELTQAITPYLQKSFFGLPVNALKQRILQIAWIDDVMVQRIWPDTVHIRFTEQVAVVRWGHQALFNPQGELFFPASDTFPQDLPILSGPAGMERQIFRTYREMDQILTVVDLRIAQVKVSHRYAWTVRLNNGSELILGKEKPIRRLKRFIAVHDQLFADHARVAESIDLRYPDGLAVRWQ
ncbi:MAG: FtsQ-type POTRA domain-containing protein [Legionellales bacterium]|nr:FtsQ-type POTRA domain-containing protein [Legionellales bacterium]